MFFGLAQIRSNCYNGPRKLENFLGKDRNMFRKILIVTMIATAAGYCFAAPNAPQIVTSEVFYTQEKDDTHNT